MLERVIAQCRHLLSYRCTYNLLIAGTFALAGFFTITETSYSTFLMIPDIALVCLIVGMLLLLWLVRWQIRTGEKYRHSGRAKISNNHHTETQASLRERNQILHDLKHTEASLRQLFNDNRDALLVLDAQSAVRYANTAAEALLQTQSLGSINQFLDLPRATGSLDEWQIVLADGTPLFVEIQSTETQWDGQAAQMLSLRDISQRKKAEEKMRLLQRGLEATYNGVLIVDTQAEDFPITYVNSAFERITGYSAEEAIGRNCRFLQGTERNQPELAKIRAALAAESEAHVVLKNFRKDGSPFWNNLYIAPVPGENGEDITHFIGVLDDISAQKKYEADLAYSASHDVLTGLLNRSLLEDRINQACRAAQRHKRRLAVVFVDLDGFKPINDTRGHHIGDQLLVEVGARIEREIRAGDTVARLGGDEFALLLSDLDKEEDILIIVERVLGWIGQPYHISGEELRITASAGITLSNGDRENPAELIHQADLAMQEAKKQGYNNYQWYTKELNQRIGERVSLRSALQNAIENCDLELHYQPQVDARNSRITGFEALCRWRHPELGYIRPEQFIDVAENTGQIVPLSEWVLETACRENQELSSGGLTKHIVAVNISPIHFQRSNFVETIKSILLKTGYPAELLELELTETILFHNPDKAIDTLHQLKALGVCLSIDDFGTGFSSLNYLKLLPVDKIKIDRSFVKDIVSDSRGAAITLGIISMAHHLDLRVTVEGIETEAQRAFLQKSNCDEFQGFMFARPMPLAELKNFLQDYK